MAKKRITIDDLAAMVQRGFKETAKQTDVDVRFDRIEGRLINLEAELSYLKARVGEITLTLDHHDELLSEHSTELKWIHQKLDELTDPSRESRVVTAKELATLENRVTALERRLAPRER